MNDKIKVRDLYYAIQNLEASDWSSDYARIAIRPPLPNTYLGGSEACNEDIKVLNFVRIDGEWFLN